MIVCDEYKCNDCGCEFIYGIDLNQGDATSADIARCIICGSTNCSKK